MLILDMSKKRLRPWLVARLNEDNIPGVKWVDKENLIFRISWKHGGKQEWNEKDARIFKVQQSIIVI